MSPIRLDKNEPATPPSTTPTGGTPSAAILLAILPLLVVTFCLLLVLLVSIDDRDSRTGHHTTPAPAVTQCGTQPTTSGTASGAHKPATVRPGRSAPKNPAAPQPPVIKVPTIRTR